MKSRHEQPGLRMRVDREARRISSQHRQLDVFYGRVVDAIEGGQARRARSEFLRLHDALEAHFTIEERMHFPALHGLRPELDEELAKLVEEHADFRATLEEIATALEAEELENGKHSLDTFVVALASHEGREELLAERVSQPSSE